jgi:hypothetical protein
MSSIKPFKKLLRVPICCQTQRSLRSFKKIYRTTSIEDHFKTFVLTQPSQLRSKKPARFRLEPSDSLKVSTKAQHLAQT